MQKYSGDFMLKKIKKNKVFRITSTIVKAIFSFFVILIVLVIFVQKVSNNKATFAGYSIFTIVSSSMTPEYNIGDMVVAKKRDTSEINIGDDVVYYGEKGEFKDKIITHRVIGKSMVDGKLVFETKGIANEVADPKINEEQIKGVVIFRGIILSFISKLVSNMYGFYFLLFVPLSVLVFLEVLDIAEERKRMKN